ncbi:hypothetical protein ACT3OH_11580, partial [Vreelandella zhanjiangensis]|uniref:hypothetical protein n=1 Tax=Vreelandella zhanjiangensis TaxID=1121960 RepID=UPI00402AB889
TIRDWVNDKKTLISQDGDKLDREIQRYFVRKMDRAPYFEEPNYSGSDEYLSCEFELYSDRGVLKSESATLCYISPGILLSLPLSVFQNSYISGKVHQLEDNFDDIIRCIYNINSVEEHIEYIRESTNFVVETSYDLWLMKNQLFSFLEFCENVEEQLRGIGQFNVIYDRLTQLDKYSKEWITGPFDSCQLPSKATGEGKSVRTDKKAKACRTFKCPDGNSRTFYWHLRATPGAIRIYFYPIEEEQKIIVGYIGPKPFYR